MNSQLSLTNQNLANILVREHILTAAELDQILEQHSLIGGRLSDFLIDTTIVLEVTLLNLFERIYGYPIADFSKLQQIDRDVTHLISGALAQLQMVIPFKRQGQIIHLAFLEPPNPEDVSRMKGLTGFTSKIYLAPRDMIRWAIATHYPELYLSVPKTVHDPFENRIGHRLIAQGLLTRQQLEEALLERTPGKAGRTGELLIRMGYIGEDDFYRSLAAQTNIPFVQIPHNYLIPTAVAALFTRADATQWQSLPVFEDAFSVTIISSEPSVLSELQALFDRTVTFMISTPSQIKFLMQQLEHQDEPLTRLLCQSGQLRVEQRALALLHSKKTAIDIAKSLLELGLVSQESLEQRQAAMPNEQVIPTEQPWEMSFSKHLEALLTQEAQYQAEIKPSSPDPSESAQVITLTQPLEKAIRALIRQELEEFKKQLQ